MQLTFITIFLFGLLTYVSADAMGIGYGSLYMQKDAKEGPRAQEESKIDVVADVLDQVIKALPIQPKELPKIDYKEGLERMKHLVLEYHYELTASDMDELHQCYYFNYFRKWHNDTISLTEQEAFCMRLIEFKPTFTEATAYKVSHRFLAMSEAFKKFIPNKPFYPTEREMLEMEECFFSRSQEQKKIVNTSQLSASETFCHRLQSDILNQTEILNGSFNPFALYHNYWNDLTLVARKDFDQILQCNGKMYNQRFTGPCKGYYKLIHKSSTIRDFRRKHVDACMRMKRSPKIWKVNNDKCLTIIATYKRIYCGFNA